MQIVNTLFPDLLSGRSTPTQNYTRTFSQLKNKIYNNNDTGTALLGTG